MLRLPKIDFHGAYKQTLSNALTTVNYKSFDKKSKLAKLMARDLSPLDEIMRPFYSEEVRPAWLHSDASTSVLLASSPDHTPSFDAFYDFFLRLLPDCNNSTYTGACFPQ